MAFDPVLLTWTPLTAETIAYAGPDAGGFGAALVRRNPDARLWTGGRADALVIEDFDGALPDIPLTGGAVVVAGMTGAAGLAALEAAGFKRPRLYRGAPSQAIFDDGDDQITDEELAADPGQRLVAVARAGGAEAPLTLRVVAFTKQLDVRTRLPAQSLRADPDLTVSFRRAPFFIMPQPSVMVLQRPRWPRETWIKCLANLIEARSILVLEIDDHPEVIARVLGEPEAGDMSLLSTAHAVQTSTPELADAFRAHNPEVAVFPNAAFDLPPFIEDRPPKRVFYGAFPRGRFPIEVARSLERVIAAHPETEFVVAVDRAVFDALPTARKSFHDYLEYEPYLALMASCSILLTPLEGGLFLGKSDVKFVEASAHGLLTIASPAVYGSIRNGDTGLVAHTLADWAPMLEKALADPAASRAIARNAYAYVARERMFAHQAAARRDWYASLMDRREDLDAAAIARLPDLAERLGRS